MKDSYKALALFSGGLDSLLSVLWMNKIGVEVIPIFFKTPFFTEERPLHTALSNGLDLKVIDISESHLEMMQNPKYGFGKNFNPCIDCHGLMFNHAGKALDDFGADFVVSGEVLGQRPMSQRRDAMNAVSNLSGIKDLIIRPLSQKLLPDTKPIRDNWIDKDNLLSFSGRSRKPQMQLAKEFNVSIFPSPGGGCRLTDKNYSIRLQDLLVNNQLNLKQIQYLIYGRHFRLSPSLKLIVGRDENENQCLSEFDDSTMFFMHLDLPGPFGVLIGEANDEQIYLAASIVSNYITKSHGPMKINYSNDKSFSNSVIVNKLNESVLQSFMIR